MSVSVSTHGTLTTKLSEPSTCTLYVLPAVVVDVFAAVVCVPSTLALKVVPLNVNPVPAV